jgi:guanylate kinase
VIERRLADAVTDMGHYGEFDYVIVNDDFPRAVDQLVQVVSGAGEHLTPRRPELSSILSNLLHSLVP